MTVNQAAQKLVDEFYQYRPAIPKRIVGDVVFRYEIMEAVLKMNDGNDITVTGLDFKYLMQFV